MAMAHHYDVTIIAIRTIEAFGGRYKTERGARARAALVSRDRPDQSVFVTGYVPRADGPVSYFHGETVGLYRNGEKIR